MHVRVWCAVLYPWCGFLCLVYFVAMEPPVVAPPRLAKVSVCVCVLCVCVHACVRACVCVCWRESLHHDDNKESFWGGVERKWFIKYTVSHMTS